MPKGYEDLDPETAILKEMQTLKAKIDATNRDIQRPTMYGTVAPVSPQMGTGVAMQGQTAKSGGHPWGQWGRNLLVGALQQGHMALTPGVAANAVSVYNKQNDIWKDTKDKQQEQLTKDTEEYNKLIIKYAELRHKKAEEKYKAEMKLYEEQNKARTKLTENEIENMRNRVIEANAPDSPGRAQDIKNLAAVHPDLASTIWSWMPVKSEKAEIARESAEARKQINEAKAAVAPLMEGARASIMDQRDKALGAMQKAREESMALSNQIKKLTIAQKSFDVAHQNAKEGRAVADELRKAEQAKRLRDNDIVRNAKSMWAAYATYETQIAPLIALNNPGLDSDQLASLKKAQISEMFGPVDKETGLPSHIKDALQRVREVSPTIAKGMVVEKAEREHFKQTAGYYPEDKSNPNYNPNAVKAFQQNLQKLMSGAAAPAMMQSGAQPGVSAGIETAFVPPPKEAQYGPTKDNMYEGPSTNPKDPPGAKTIWTYTERGWAPYMRPWAPGEKFPPYLLQKQEMYDPDTPHNKQLNKWQDDTQHRHQTGKPGLTFEEYMKQSGQKK